MGGLLLAGLGAVVLAVIFAVRDARVERELQWEAFREANRRRQEEYLRERQAAFLRSQVRRWHR